MKNIALKDLIAYAPSIGTDREFQIIRKILEIEDWCKNNFEKNKWYMMYEYNEDRDHYPVFFFKNNYDYTLFCLTWV